MRVSCWISGRASCFESSREVEFARPVYFRVQFLMVAPVGDEGMWVGGGERCIWRRVGVRMSKKYFVHEKEPSGARKGLD